MGMWWGHHIVSHFELIPVNQILGNIFKDVIVFYRVTQYLVVGAEQGVTTSLSILWPLGLREGDYAIVAVLVEDPMSLLP